MLLAGSTRFLFLGAGGTHTHARTHAHARTPRPTGLVILHMVELEVQGRCSPHTCRSTRTRHTGPHTPPHCPLWSFTQTRSERKVKRALARGAPPFTHSSPFGRKVAHGHRDARGGRAPARTTPTPTHRPLPIVASYARTAPGCGVGARTFPLRLRGRGLGPRVRFMQAGSVSIERGGSTRCDPALRGPLRPRALGRTPRCCFPQRAAQSQPIPSPSQP